MLGNEYERDPPLKANRCLFLPTVSVEREGDFVEPKVFSKQAYNVGFEFLAHSHGNNGLNPASKLQGCDEVPEGSILQHPNC